MNAAASDGGHVACAENFWRDEGDYLINDPGTQYVECQVRPAFHEKTLDFAFIEFGGQRFQTFMKQQCIGKFRHAATPIEDNAKKRSPSGKPAAVGKLWIVFQDRAAARDESVTSMTKALDSLA